MQKLPSANTKTGRNGTSNEEDRTRAAVSDDNWSFGFGDLLRASQQHG